MTGAQIKPVRTGWGIFPDVVIHATETSVKRHPAYIEAKSGSFNAASLLIQDTVSQEATEKLMMLVAGRLPLLASAHAFERAGVNAIPETLADELARRTGLPIDNSIVQVNVVGHTGASGFVRLANQAMFDGKVIANADYLLVDDFIGQGGTLANLKGFIESHGGRVIGATVLTGKPYSAKLSTTDEQIATLRTKHGKELEAWWQQRFGHAFDCLTQSEARYLERSPDADTIRDRIVAAEQTGNRRAIQGDPQVD